MSEAWGTGLATLTGDGRVLDVLFADPRLGAPEGDPGTTTGAVVHERPRRGVQLVEAPTDAYDAYLRLHLLSHRLVKPHGLSLEGLFGVLPNVAWTSQGPVDPAALADVRTRFRSAGEPLQVFSVDKFPRMTDYVVPSGVRIADAD